MWKNALKLSKTNEFKTGVLRELKNDTVILVTGLAIMFILSQFLSVEIYWHLK